MNPTDGDDLRTCLTRAIAGDRAAADRLIAALYPLVAKIVRSHVPRGVAAEDWEQDAFVRILAGIDRYRGDAPVEHWAAKVTVNACLDQLRQRKRQRRTSEVRFADLTEAEAAAALQSAANAEADPLAARDLVDRLMESLDPEGRIVIHMLDLEQRPVPEVADLLGRGQPWIRMRAYRARKSLVATLQRLERERPR